MDRLRFLYVNNSCFVNHLEYDKDWGVILTELKELQVNLKHHFKHGDFTPNQPSFLNAYEEMEENKF